MNLNCLPLYGIALLTHSSLLSDSNDIVELRKAEKCLKFIMDPLIDCLESTPNIECIKSLLKKVKLSKNCLEPNNESLNVVSELINLDFNQKEKNLQMTRIEFFNF